MTTKSSLKRHLALGVLLIFILTQGVFGLINYWNLKTGFEKDVEENSDALLELVNSNFEHFIETPVALLSQMKSFIPKKITNDNKNFIQTYIGTVESVYPFIDRIMIIDAEGFQVLQAPFETKNTLSSYKNESFFKNPPTGDEVLWTNVYLSELTHKPTIAMSIKLDNYIVVADLNLDALHAVLFRVYNESVTSISLLDAYGSYLYDDDHKKVDLRLHYPKFEEIKKISENNARYIYKDKTGNRMVMATKLGVQNSGYLVIEQNYDFLQAGINDFTKSLLVSFGILVILGLLLIAFLMRKIMNDFRILSSISQDLAMGRYDDQSSLCDYYETQAIANDFNSMRHTLVNREKEILELNENLESLVEERTESLQLEISERIKAENALEALNRELEKRVFERTLDVERSNHTLEEMNAQLEEEIHEHTNTLMMLRDKENDLEYALNVAREASLAKSQFLANMSHEIRTPMNGILGMINVLLLSTLSETQREYVGTIHSSANTLMVILNDILDYSKIEAGKVTLRKQLFGIENVLRDLKNLFISSATHKHITLDIVIDEDLPQYVLGDETRLRQVLSNLIGNAIKFTDHGGVTITSHIVEVKPSQILVAFKIVDTGLGISSADQNHIFDRFEQGSNTSSVKTKGTGLGLAISKMLVELMGGKIHLKSTLNKGSTFVVEVPFEMKPQLLKSDEEQNEGPNEVPNEVPINLSGVTILVAEDDITSAFVMLTMLENLGARVDIAENGKIAIEKSTNKVYDLILMDVNMPVLNGLNATKQIRKLKMLSNTGLPIPVVAITAFAAEGDRDRCFSFGVDDYITKPVDFKLLFLKILNLVKEGRIKGLEEVDLDTQERNLKTNLMEKETMNENYMKKDFKSNSISDNRASYVEIVEALCEASGFDTETAEYIIQTYLTQTTEVIETLKLMTKSESFEENHQEIANLLHKLKGSSGNVRANRIMALAVDAEELCKGGDQAGVVRLIGEIFSQLESYKEGLNEVGLI